ncbi:MAG: hypothetical protein NC124_06035 [Clostridium sp.]|nr:hypothetical protein [Clostridium sp.]
MKNLKYFPFERNRYFYGKLLSVDDFRDEQRYMNDKRRMLNRFLYGTGVVCGMQVVEIDDVTISLEMGIALDFSGREIVVDRPVTKKLSSVEGFSQYAAMEEERGELYLCIAYDEKEADPVYNVTRANSEQGEEFNKYVEGYRLYVTTEEPEKQGGRIADLYEGTQTVFQGEGIRILQTVPRYVKSGTSAAFTVTVEKTWQTKPVSFSYQLRLSGMEQSGAETAFVSFDENQNVPADRYVITGQVQAKSVNRAEGFMELVSDSFQLTVGQDIKKDLVRGKFRISIIDTDVERAVIGQYYRSAMEDIIRDSYEQPIYLARLNVIRAGDTYVIERVENLPYAQYVWNNVLSQTVEYMRAVRDKEPVRYAGSRPVERENPREAGNGEQQVQTGSVVIHLGAGAAPGQRFCSEEIIHGLGLGEVFISLALSDRVSDKEYGIFGNPDVFEDVSSPKLELAARTDAGRGSFVIGVKCLSQLNRDSVKVSWLAVRDNTVQEKERGERQLAIRPDIVNLQIRESHYFEALSCGEIRRHIEWRVKEADGGTIDDNGYYTAPSRSGVYEIIAQDKEDVSLTAMAFVIVRDVI